MTNLTELKEIISAALLIIAIVSFIVSWIFKKSKNKKLIELSSKLESAASTALAIKNVAQTAVTLAEQYIDYSGEDKKSWAKTYIKEYCIKNNVPYTDEVLNRTIEELINFSKKVNATDEKRIESESEEEINE